MVAPAEGTLGSILCPCYRQGDMSFCPQQPGAFKPPCWGDAVQGHGDAQLDEHPPDPNSVTSQSSPGNSSDSCTPDSR